MAEVATLAWQRRAERARLTATARRLAAREWRTLNQDDIRSSYADVYARLLFLLSSAQEQAASGAGSYLSRVIAAQGGSTDDFAVNAAAWRGIASDGRSLADLLRIPVWYTMNALSGGSTPGQALGIGGNLLDRIFSTQVTDAGRTSDGVAVTASGVSGYERIAAPPCCDRCAILGGQVYRWSTGFERHPYCDCFMLPVMESYAKRVGSDPMQLFRSGQIRGMSQADIKAVNDGADLNRVVNAKRGMYTAAGRNASGLPRLMPEQIYRMASTRDEAISLLRSFGFIL